MKLVRSRTAVSYEAEGCGRHPVFPAPSDFESATTKRKARAKNPPRERFLLFEISLRTIIARHIAVRRMASRSPSSGRAFVRTRWLAYDRAIQYSAAVAMLTTSAGGYWMPRLRAFAGHAAEAVVASCSKPLAKNFAKSGENRFAISGLRTTSPPSAIPCCRLPSILPWTSSRACPASPSSACAGRRSRRIPSAPRCRRRLLHLCGPSGRTV